MDSAVLSSIGTAITYEVSRSIQVSVYLLLAVVTGNFPIVSMAIHTKGILGISSCNWGDVKHCEGFRTCDAVVDVTLYISSHPFPPKIFLGG